MNSHLSPPPTFIPRAIAPAVREALEQRAWDEARQQIPLVAQTLERYAAEIERATSALEP